MSAKWASIGTSGWLDSWRIGMLSLLRGRLWWKRQKYKAFAFVAFANVLTKAKLSQASISTIPGLLFDSLCHSFTSAIYCTDRPMHIHIVFSKTRLAQWTKSSKLCTYMKKMIKYRLFSVDLPSLLVFVLLYAQFAICLHFALICLNQIVQYNMNLKEKEKCCRNDQKRLANHDRLHPLPITSDWVESTA